MRLVFAIPVVAGISILWLSLAMFRREQIDPRYFAYALVISGLTATSPLVYLGLIAVTDLLGLVYTFVLAFGLGLLFLVAMVVYLLLQIGSLRSDVVDLNQELALLEAELRETDD